MIAKIIFVFFSFYCNIRCFDFKTVIKMPLFFSYHVKVSGLKKNCIVLESSARFVECSKWDLAKALLGVEREKQCFRFRVGQ